MGIGLGDITIYHDLNGNGVLDGGEPAVRPSVDSIAAVQGLESRIPSKRILVSRRVTFCPHPV